MLEFKNIYLFNVAETKQTQSGLLLYRFPKTTIKKLGFKENQKGKEKSKIPTMVEIRFSSYQPTIKIVLKSLDADVKVFCFVDEFQNGEKILKKGILTDLEFSVHERFIKNYHKIYGTKAFFYRIILSNGSRVLLNDINIPLESLPKMQIPWVVYGSSISSGVGASTILDSYVFLTQQKMKIDILNKSLSGSCLLEASTIEYLSKIDCCGYILEIGANVRGVMNKEEFSLAFYHLLNELKKKNIPIIIISILDMFESLYKNLNYIEYHEKNIEFISIIKKIVKEVQNGKIFLYSSKSWVKEINDISADLLHPSNQGHYNLSIGLMKVFKKLLYK